MADDIELAALRRLESAVRACPSHCWEHGESLAWCGACKRFRDGDDAIDKALAALDALRRVVEG